MWLLGCPPETKVKRYVRWARLCPTMKITHATMILLMLFAVGCEKQAESAPGTVATQVAAAEANQTTLTLTVTGMT